MGHLLLISYLTGPMAMTIVLNPECACLHPETTGRVIRVWWPVEHHQRGSGLRYCGIAKTPATPFGYFLFSACTVTQWKITMQTIQYRRTRIWEIKKDKYTKTLAKNQVCEIFQMRDIGKNGLPKFIKLCMETPCWCPFQEHQYGRRIPTETSVFQFSY